MTARNFAAPSSLPTRPDTGRRSVLRSALALLAAPALGLAPALIAAPAGAAPGAEFVARRHGGCYLVEGWVLTAADVRALGIPVAPDPADGPARRGAGGPRA